MTETDVPDYDAMSPSDRAFALFTAVEAARSKAIAEMREAGWEIDYDAKNEAHQAALAVWNAWAQPLLEERETLEEAGEWKHIYEEPFVSSGNDVTVDFLRRADLDASSFTFADVGFKDVSVIKDENSSKSELPTKTIICDTIKLEDFTFPGDTSFNNTIFEVVSNFYKSAFKGYAHFCGTNFRNLAFFSHTSFANYTLFNDASFKDHVSYTHATSRGRIYFRNTVFNSTTEFSHSTFKKDVTFFRANFKSVVTFYDTTFEGPSDFRSAQFRGDASFSYAQFKGDADFVQVDFLSHADFSETVFSLGSDWTAINAVRTFNMAGARFETQVPQFTQAYFTESPRVDNVELPEPGRGHSTLPAPKPETGWVTKVHSWGWVGGNRNCEKGNDTYHSPFQSKWEKLEYLEEIGDAPDGETRREIERGGKHYRYRERKLPKPKTGKKIDADDIAAYAALRRIAKQGEDHETKLKAFAGEMRTRRVAGGLEWPYRLFSWAYDLFTDFGASFAKPFALWLFLTLASAGVYAVAANSEKPAGCDTLTSSVQLSLHNALLFATAGQRTFVQDAQICLYGQEAKSKRSLAPAWLGLFGTVQTLLSAMLIFFILLALRNRFKI